MEEFILDCFTSLIEEIMALPLNPQAKMQIIDLLLKDDENERN